MALQSPFFNKREPDTYAQRQTSPNAAAAGTVASTGAAPSTTVPVPLVTSAHDSWRAWSRSTAPSAGAVPDAVGTSGAAAVAVPENSRPTQTTQTIQSLSMSVLFFRSVRVCGYAFRMNACCPIAKKS